MGVILCTKKGGGIVDIWILKIGCKSWRLVGIYLPFCRASFLKKILPPQLLSPNLEANEVILQLKHWATRQYTQRRAVMTNLCISGIFCIQN